MLDTTLQKLISFIFTNIIVVICVIVAVFYQTAQTEIANKVVFFDVGQGDSALIQVDGKNILIDTGDDGDIVYKLGEYLGIREQNIDLLIITHEHSDHYGGVSALCESYFVNQIITLGDTTKYEYISCEKGVGVRSENLELPEGMNGVNIGSCILQVIKPIIDKGSSGKVGNDSIITRLECNNGSSVLFMGDSETDEEKEMSGLYDEIFSGEIEIVKAGHHCSDTSSSAEFVEMVSPEAVICSVGKDNKYGHPSHDVIERYEKIDAKAFITYESGDVVFELDTGKMYNNRSSKYP